MKFKLLNVLMISVIFCIIFSQQVYASYFATAIGTTENNINTTNHINDAASAYDNSGYSNSRRLMDPS